jgi:hypothetical protein
MRISPYSISFYPDRSGDRHPEQVTSFIPSMHDRVQFGYASPETSEEVLKRYFLVRDIDFQRLLAENLLRKRLPPYVQDIIKGIDEKYKVDPIDLINHIDAVMDANRQSTDSEISEKQWKDWQALKTYWSVFTLANRPQLKTKRRGISPWRKNPWQSKREEKQPPPSWYYTPEVENLYPLRQYTETQQPKFRDTAGFFRWRTTPGKTEQIERSEVKSWADEIQAILRRHPVRTGVDKALLTCAMRRINKITPDGNYESGEPYRRWIREHLLMLPEAEPLSQVAFPLAHIIHMATFEPSPVKADPALWFASKKERQILERHVHEVNDYFALWKFLIDNDLVDDTQENPRLLGWIVDALVQSGKRLKEDKDWHHSHRPVYDLIDTIRDEHQAGRADSDLVRLAWEHLVRACKPSRDSGWFREDVELYPEVQGTILGYMRNIPVPKKFLGAIDRHVSWRDYFPDQYSGPIYFPDNLEREKEYLCLIGHKAPPSFILSAMEYFRKDSAFCEELKATLMNRELLNEDLWTVFEYAFERRKGNAQFYKEACRKVREKAEGAPIPTLSFFEQRLRDLHNQNPGDKSLNRLLAYITKQPRRFYARYM